MPHVDHTDLSEYVTGLIAALLERIGLPFLLLDGDRGIRLASAASETILAEGRHAARDADGRLLLHSDEATERLSGFIARLDAADDAGIDLPLPAADDAPPLFASVSAFAPPPRNGFPALPPVALMLIRDGNGDEAITAAQAQFGLSQAEAQVARAIVDGISVGDYATTRGLSVHTARKQLGAAMRKLGVTRQANIASVILRLQNGGGR